MAALVSPIRTSDDIVHAAKVFDLRVERICGAPRSPLDFRVEMAADAGRISRQDFEQMIRASTPAICRVTFAWPGQAADTPATA